MSHTETVFGQIPKPELARIVMPDEMLGFNRRVKIGGQDAYIRLGCLDNGQPVKIITHMSKKGSPISGFVSDFSESMSMNLQAGYSLEEVIEKFGNTSFEPSGFTNDPCIPEALSLIDYIATLLGVKFLSVLGMKRVRLKAKCLSCNLVDTCERRSFARRLAT